MSSGKPGQRKRNARGVAVIGRSVPWAWITGVAVVLMFAAAVFGYAVLQGRSNTARDAAGAGFTPSATEQDPSARIPGIIKRSYQGGQHVTGAEQVAYTQSPPLGGTHDQFWAACNGVVYDRPVRTENLVHSMEHGAVWIAYNPDQVTGDALGALTRRVQGKPYTVLSPYPGLSQPVAVQSWGHQLTLADTADPRIDQFLAALRANPYTHPENGASCQALGPGRFDQDQPPPFRPAPPASAVGQPGVRADTEAAAPGGAGSMSGGGS